MTTLTKLAERCVWVAAAAGVSYVVSQLASDNNLVGPLTPLLYIAMRLAQDYLNPNLPNK